MSTENDNQVIVEVTVKVPVSVTVKAPLCIAEDSDRGDLCEIVEQAIQSERHVVVEWKNTIINCTVGPHWDSLPEQEMETMSTECGMWGE